MSTRNQNLAVVERYLLVTTKGDLNELPDLVHSRVKAFDGEDRISGVSKVRAYFEGMRSRLTGIRLAAGLYPRAWRERCGRELDRGWPACPAGRARHLRRNQA